MKCGLELEHGLHNLPTNINELIIQCLLNELVEVTGKSKHDIANEVKELVISKLQDNLKLGG